MTIEEKIHQRLEVIKFSVNMLNAEIRKRDFIQPYLLRQKDKLSIERKVLKNLLK